MGTSESQKAHLGQFVGNGRGDFNDIRNNEEKNGGTLRQESSFRDFRDFIAEMGMEGIKFK